MGSDPTAAFERLPPDDVIRRRVKAEIRKRQRALRKTTPAPACAERSALIVARLEQHPAIVSARKVALFWPMLDRHEVDLRALDASLRVRGVSVSYPVVLPSNDMVFCAVVAHDVLEERGQGFLAPPAGPDEPDLDVIVVPALAIDPQGDRIGYGAGYYDRALRARRGLAHPVLAIGVAYDFQLIPEVPRTEGDERVDVIVTDRRSLLAGDAAPA